MSNKHVLVVNIGYHGTPLQALGRMGKHEEALWVLRKCWGGMIELGGTMFWETFAQAPEWISGDWTPSPGAALPTRVPWSWSGTSLQWREEPTPVVDTWFLFEYLIN